MYTSGTTGNPKGAIRNHRGGAMLSLITEIELGMHRNDGALLVMPMCHANSLYFFSAFAYCGATTTVYSRKNFDPEHCVRVLGEGVATFTSMVPTHYAMMLALPQATRAELNLDRVAKLMISSAPARPDAKRAIMEMFPNAGLFELYGSTETGWVTMLHPHEQFDKLGSVGRECVGSAPIKLLDPNGDEVPDGEIGELYASNPYIFDGYWKLPEKTREAFRGDYCTVGDMARRDSDGFIHLVDRKSNMIITGGENVYPSDVEAVISGHPSVHDVAVIGLPDDKWGERVHAVIVLREGSAQDEASLHEWCKSPHGRIQASALIFFHARRRDAAHRDGQEPAPQVEGDDPRLNAVGLSTRQAMGFQGATRWRRAPMISMLITNPAPPGSRAFSRRAASTAFSVCRAATSSRSGTMRRNSAFASSMFATRWRPSTWRTRMQRSQANSASPWSRPVRA